MTSRLVPRRAAVTVAAASALCCAALSAAPAAPSLASALAGLTPLSTQAPDAPASWAGGTTNACNFTDNVTPSKSYASYVHCHTASEVRKAYGLGTLATGGGAGQTIVLVDAYGSPTATQDLQHFAAAMGGPAPHFTQVFPYGQPDYSNGNVGNGQSGSGGAEGWAGEATLDIEWAYAIAPKANLVLIAVPPAETLGVQGFPNLFKAMSDAVDRYPSGTVFSMSFGVSEETFGGAAQQQTARFDEVFKKGLRKGDTFFASSGDDGTEGVSKQHRDSVTYDHPVVGWPASSPYVTAVGGTQLQDYYTWDPQSDVFSAAYFHDIRPTSTPSEPVWNEAWLSIATGGGKSIVYPRPSWQQGVKNVVGNARGVPDLSWNAAVDGGVLVWTSFFPKVDRVGWHVYGGTSAASPQVAALTALANQARGAKGPIGYLNPVLYTNPSLGPSGTSTYNGGGAFRDIVKHTYGTVESGKLWDNQLWTQTDTGVTKDSIPGYPVTPGYDLTTGWGSPRAGGYVSALVAATRAPAP